MVKKFVEAISTEFKFLSQSIIVINCDKNVPEDELCQTTAIVYCKPKPSNLINPPSNKRCNFFNVFYLNFKITTKSFCFREYRSSLIICWSHIVRTIDINKSNCQHFANWMKINDVQKKNLIQIIFKTYTISCNW